MKEVQSDTCTLGLTMHLNSGTTTKTEWRWRLKTPGTERQSLANSAAHVSLQKEAQSNTRFAERARADFTVQQNARRKTGTTGTKQSARRSRRK